MGNIESPIGPLTLVAGDHGLREVRLGASPDEYDAYPVLDEAERQLGAYFAGELERFDLPLDLVGLTDFQRDVLDAISDIPYGEVATYGDIAAAVGRPRAARAVGGACNANPVAIVIPCHRVVASNGIGGYGSGLSIKRHLLGLEADQQRLPASVGAR